MQSIWYVVSSHVYPELTLHPASEMLVAVSPPPHVGTDASTPFVPASPPPPPFVASFVLASCKIVSSPLIFPPHATRSTQTAASRMTTTVTRDAVAFDASALHVEVTA